MPFKYYSLFYYSPTTNELFRYEKKLRELGSTVIIVHHLNKLGAFADTQHIENYADYTYLIERNEFNGCILLNPKRQAGLIFKQKPMQLLIEK